MTRLQAFSRLISRRRALTSRPKSYREKFTLTHSVPPSIDSNPPRSPKGKERERVIYKPEATGSSLERRAYFTGEDLTLGNEEEDLPPGLEIGRVVECRRNGTSAIGLLLAHIIMNGRPRLILLRTSGEIWPISSNDIQFIMPSSLIPLSLAEACWSPDLIESWAKGDESQGEDTGSPMMIARREAVVILRKVNRETERMIGRLNDPGGAGKGRGVESIWEEIMKDKAEEERGKLTAAEVAEYLLSIPGKKVKPNTLPAYAAHKILMGTAELFIPSENDMWDTGIFLLRSKGEKERLDLVESWIEGHTRELSDFIDKVRKALKSQTKIEWNGSDRIILSILLLRLYETRSTQISPSNRLSISILRLLDVYPGIADQAAFARLLTDLGILPTTDSLNLSKVVETESREMVMSTLPPTSEEMYKGTEFDGLREDFSNHTIWVIDDPTAKELDDGISLTTITGSEDIWVHCHIADPTRILPIDHPLAIQASFRGGSIYLPEGNLPLLPLKELMTTLSLGVEGQGVMTFSARLSPSGEIKETSVKPGWIKGARLTTYGDVDVATGVKVTPPSRPFGNTPHSTPSPRSPITPSEIPQLELLRKTAISRRKARLSSGGLDYSLQSGTPHLTSQSPPYENIFSSQLPSSTTSLPSTPMIDYTVPSPSTSMTASSTVAEFMMLAGHVAALYCIEHNLPAPFRGAAKPQQLHIPGVETMSLSDLLSYRNEDGTIDPYIVWKSKLVFPSATITTTPLPHFNMGFEGGYVRSTSPLRRYDDLLVHWQLKHHLASQNGLKWGRKIDHDEMGTLARRSKEGQSRSKRAGKSADAFWTAGAFAQRLSKPSEQGIDLREGVKAKIAGQSSPLNGELTTPVHIPSLGIMARLTSKKGFEIGEEVNVRIMSAIQWPSPLITVQIV